MSTLIAFPFRKKPPAPSAIERRQGAARSVRVSEIRAFDLEAIANASKLMKSARVYIEGTIKLDKWTAQDGTERQGLSCLSWHTRLAQIGNNRPKRDGAPASAPANQRAQRPVDDMDDAIPY